MSSPSQTLAVRFLSEHPEEAASLLDAMPPDGVAALLLELPPNLAANVLARTTVACGADAFRHMPAAAVAHMLVDIPPRVAAILLSHLSADAQRDVLEGLPGRKAVAVREHLTDRRESIGAHMDPTALALRATLTVAQAQLILRRSPNRFHQRLYVVDTQERLLGALDPVVMLAADPETPLSDCGLRPVTRLQRRHPLAVAARLEAWKRWTVVPVVDSKERFVGILQRDTVMRLEQLRSRTLVSRPLSVALSFAELLWLGLAAMTGGIHDRAPRRTGVSRHREDTP